MTMPHTRDCVKVIEDKMEGAMPHQNQEVYCDHPITDHSLPNQSAFINGCMNEEERSIELTEADMKYLTKIFHVVTPTTLSYYNQIITPLDQKRLIIPTSLQANGIDESI
jgi:hypothetical protein